MCQISKLTLTQISHVPKSFFLFLIVNLAYLTISQKTEFRYNGESR